MATVDPLLKAEGVVVMFPGSSAPAVNNVSLDLAPGAAIGVVGESGSGKSTLARTLVGALKPTAGRVVVSGKEWSAVKRKDPIRRTVQMIFQDPFSSLNPRRTALDIVAQVFAVQRGSRRSVAADQAREVLKEVGLTGELTRQRTTRLSGGERQRVGIARALACDPSILIADEPTSSLDVSVQAQILNLLLDLRATRQLAMVFISHDLSVIRYVTEEVLVMCRGEVVERGETERVLEKPEHEYTIALVSSIVDLWSDGPAVPGNAPRG